MIVCSCNCITDKEIHDAVDDLMLANPVRVLTPGQVYKSIGSRPNCGSCLSHAADLIHKRTASLRGCHECPHTAKYAHTPLKQRSEKIKKIIDLEDSSRT